MFSGLIQRFMPVAPGEVKNYLQSEVTSMARRLYNRDQHPPVSGDPEKVLAVTN
jgi:hypothetical protein